MEGKKILIADDNIVNLKSLEKILTDAGYTVFAASNGAEAIETALRELPDLVILDIVMPGLDGGEVAHVLRSKPKTKHIPIFFFSFLIQKDEEKCMTKDKITLYFAKPINRKKLLNKIRKYI